MVRAIATLTSPRPARTRTGTRNLWCPDYVRFRDYQMFRSLAEILEVNEMTTVPMFPRELLLTAEPGRLRGERPLSHVPAENQNSKER